MEIFKISRNNKLDVYLKDQLSRAALSVSLNLAEGAGRSGVRDRRHFFTMSRASLFETIAILDFLLDIKLLENKIHNNLLIQMEVISKQLYSMTKNG
ncbi:MAG: four helix bundle protein [Bacteroidetes bacterium]|nr:four helix bundle protein [Bacteroidota bacterium]